MTHFHTLSVTTRAPGVAQVTMNRPAVFNAFDEAMIAELDQAFEALAADNASFAVSEAKFGILPSVIGPYVTNAVSKRSVNWIPQ